MTATAPASPRRPRSQLPWFLAWARRRRHRCLPLAATSPFLTRPELPARVQQGEYVSVRLSARRNGVSSALRRELTRRIR